MTPLRAARDRPETSAIGAARISGHGVATTTTASARTGSPLSAHARPATTSVIGQEDAGVAVGHPHERGALGLCLLDEPHERGVRALGRGAVGAHVERAAGVDAAAHHGHPGAQRHRQRLAAERAGVDDGLVADHRAVDGHDLSGAHEDRVPGADAVDRHLFDPAVDPQLGDARCALDQQRQLAARAAGCRGLERRAAGEHQADDRAGEFLAERQRPDHRDERDRVDAEVMIDDDGAADLERELGGKQRHRGPPHLVPGVSCAERVQQESGGDRDDGDHSEDLRAGLGELVQRRADARTLIGMSPGTSPVEHDARLSCRHPCPAAVRSPWKSLDRWAVHAPGAPLAAAWRRTG